MSLLLKSLSGLETIAQEDLLPGQRVTLITAGGFKNVTWGSLVNAISDPLSARMDILENAIDQATSGGSGASVWPIARTITLTGAVTGSVAIDGSQNVSMATSIADGSLTLAKVDTLSTRLSTLDNQMLNVWGTGYTAGPQPTAFTGNANLISGATFLSAVAGTATNIPTGGSGNFALLTNGPNNYGQQLALRGGEAWIRGQNLGTWGGWNKFWTSANLDPSTLLLKSDTAGAATKLATARAFSLTGPVTAAGINFDGTGNVVLATAIADAALTIAKTSGLQAVLDLKYEDKGLIASGTSLNTVLSSGYYRQSSAGSVTIGDGYPVAGVTGVLLVFKSGSFISQEYLTTTNLRYRRNYDGVSWTAWVKMWSTLDFDPTTKFDKTGGTVNGPITSTSTVYAETQFSTSGTFYSHKAAVEGSPVFAFVNDGTADRQRGVRVYADSVALSNLQVSNATAHELRIYDNGGLQFDGKDIYHTGNFTPSNPVAVGGILNIGDPGAANLRFRYDGKYSLDAGATWRDINESEAINPNPNYTTVTIGAGSDAKLFSDIGHDLAVQTGAPGFEKYFTFDPNGNFSVPDGRVMIAGNEAWHAGNFNPSTKLGVSATAAAATKLATARTINGVAFDGTANISIPSNIDISTADDISIRKAAGLYRTTAALAADGWPADGAGTWVALSVTDSDTGSYQALQIASNTADVNTAAIRATNGSGTTPWKKLWHEGTFDPATKQDALGYTPVNPTAAVIDGTTDSRITFKVAGIRRGLLAVNAGTGVGSLVVYQEDGGTSLGQLDIGTGGLKYDSNVVWHAGTFNPASKLDARAELAIQASQITDWNLANTNGWYMASGAANAPNGSSWFLGTVTRHNPSWIQQEVRDFTQGVNGTKWRRWCLNGTWGAWTQDEFWAGGISGGRVFAGWDSGNAGSISCSNWFRSSGQTGIFFNDYGGGLYMTDTTYVRAYNNKAMAANWFETTGGFSPQTSAANCGFRTSGSYGGGYGMIDGSYHITMFSIGGDLQFGFGSGSATAKASVGKDGVYHGTDFALNSDKTLKKRIRDLKFNGRLRPVTFVWKESGKSDFGFIAQEIQQQYSDAVDTDPRTGKLRLMQGKLTAVLAVQTNQNSDDIEDLRKQVDAMAAQLEQLKQLVADLRSQ